MVWPRQKDARGKNTKIIVDWIQQEGGKRGRARKTWMEGVQAAMTTSNLDTNTYSLTHSLHGAESFLSS